jgi:hypothetical protein
MKTLRFYGKMITADFEEKTMTFEIENEMVVQAGDYVMLTLSDYANLVSENKTSNESEVCSFENKCTLYQKSNCKQADCGDFNKQT